MNSSLGLKADESKSLSETRRRVFEKVRQRMAEIGVDSPFNRKAPPDVIVTPADQVLFFEPQNWPVTQWLHERCGLSMDNVYGCERIPVHPCQRNKIVSELKAAGFEVAG